MQFLNLPSVNSIRMTAAQADLHVPEAISANCRRAEARHPTRRGRSRALAHRPRLRRRSTSTPRTATCCGAATSPPPPSWRATRAGEPVGFVTGYVRPDRPRHPARLAGRRRRRAPRPRTRRRPARRADRAGRRRARADARRDHHHARTTPPPSACSPRSPSATARALEREVLFDAELFPEDGHEPEVLYRIGPSSDPLIPVRHHSAPAAPRDPVPLTPTARPLPGDCCDHHPARPERLRDPRVRGAQLLPRLAHRLRPRAGQPHVRRGRPRATSTSSPAPGRSTTATTTPS